MSGIDDNNLRQIIIIITIIIKIIIKSIIITIMNVNPQRQMCLEENSRVAKSTKPDLNVFLNAVNNNIILIKKTMMIMMMKTTTTTLMMLKRCPATRKGTRLRSS